MLSSSVSASISSSERLRFESFRSSDSTEYVSFFAARCISSSTFVRKSSCFPSDQEAMYGNEYSDVSSPNLSATMKAVDSACTSLSFLSDCDAAVSRDGS